MITELRPTPQQPVIENDGDGIYWLFDGVLMYAPYSDDGIDWENAGDVDLERSDLEVIERARQFTKKLQRRTDQGAA